MGICRINFIANGMRPNISIFNLPCLGKKLKESGKFTKYLSHNLFWGKTNILITMLTLPVCESFKFQVWQRAICIMHCKGKIKTRKKPTPTHIKHFTVWYSTPCPPKANRPNQFQYEQSEVKFINAVTAGGTVNFFASGVNFSRNNAIYIINESTKYILPWLHL